MGGGRWEWKGRKGGREGVGSWRVGEVGRSTRMRMLGGEEGRMSREAGGGEGARKAGSMKGE